MISNDVILLETEVEEHTVANHWYCCGDGTDNVWQVKCDRTEMIYRR